MRVTAFADKGYIGSQRGVAGDPFPDELKRVLREPHILPTSGHGIDCLRRIELRHPRQPRTSKIGMVFEDSNARFVTMKKRNWKERKGEQNKEGKSHARHIGFNAT